MNGHTDILPVCFMILAVQREIGLGNGLKTNRIAGLLSSWSVAFIAR
jgi:hypothetical protein